MHTLQLVEEALELATQLGYEVRQEWLGASGGGLCELRGRRCIFLDLALSPTEQAEQLAAALAADERLASLALSPAMRRFLGWRKSA